MNWIFKTALVTIILAAVSCAYVDVFGIISSRSQNVRERFIDKDNLPVILQPNVADKSNFSFLVISDLHYYDGDEKYFEDISADNKYNDVSFIVVCGDVAQSGLKHQYDYLTEDLKNVNVPVYYVIGNHDLYNNGYEEWRNILGRTVYEFKIGDNHFIFTDTANGTIGAEQRSWIIGALSASNSVNKFVFSHYSPTDKEFQSPTALSYPEDAYFLYDVLEKYGVKYYICGHLHFYDEKEIRGVKYIIVNTAQSRSDRYLKITIKNNIISKYIY